MLRVFELIADLGAHRIQIDIGHARQKYCAGKRAACKKNVAHRGVPEHPLRRVRQQPLVKETLIKLLRSPGAEGHPDLPCYGPPIGHRYLASPTSSQQYAREPWTAAVTFPG